MNSAAKRPEAAEIDAEGTVLPSALTHVDCPPARFKSFPPHITYSSPHAPISSISALPLTVTSRPISNDWRKFLELRIPRRTWPRFSIVPSTSRSIGKTRRENVNGASRGSAGKLRVRENLVRTRSRTDRRKRKNLNPATFPLRCASASSREQATSANTGRRTGRGVAPERNSRSNMSAPLRSIVITRNDIFGYCAADITTSKRNVSTGRSSSERRLMEKGFRLLNRSEKEGFYGYSVAPDKELLGKTLHPTRPGSTPFTQYPEKFYSID